MGSTHSSGRKRIKQNANQLSDRYVDHQDSYKIKKVPKRDVFVWKIVGFKSLLEQGAHYTATAFKMQGFTWYLYINPMDWNTTEEKHVSLSISTSLYPEEMLETKFKFFIHDQLYGKHVEREVRHTFLTASCRCGVSCMVPLKTLKDTSLGFLVNDTIVVGVELIKTMPCNGLVRSSIMGKNKSSESYSWNIEDFYQLDSPVAFSSPFRIANYNWRLKLQQGGGISKEYVSIYLTLDESQLPPSSGVMVNVVFSIKTPPSGSYKKRISCNFTPRNTNWGSTKFLRIEDFKNPANGYLIKGKCTFKASISIVGSSNDGAS